MHHERDPGFHHSAVFIDSEEEVCRVMADSAREGVAVGEGVVIAADDDREACIRSRLGGLAADIRFVTADDHYRTPRDAMRALVAIFKQELRSGRPRIRSIGEVQPEDPHSEWIRYEAAVNEVLADFPVTGVCVFDTRRLSDGTREAIEQTHRYLGATKPWRDSDRFRDPRQVASELPVAAIHPDHEPDQVIGTVSDIRQVRMTAAGLAPAGRSADVALVVHELVAMAMNLGSGSPQVRLWSEANRLTMQVLSSGGFDDPFAGLRPAKPDDDDAALWIAAHLADDLSVAPVDSVSAATVYFEEDRPG